MRIYLQAKSLYLFQKSGAKVIKIPRFSFLFILIFNQNRPRRSYKELPFRCAEQAIIDACNEKIGRKIRDNELKHIPYMLVVGEKEQEEGTVAVRRQGGEALGTMTIAEFAKLICDEVAEQTAAC